MSGSEVSLEFLVQVRNTLQSELGRFHENGSEFMLIIEDMCDDYDEKIKEYHLNESKKIN